MFSYSVSKIEDRCDFVVHSVSSMVNPKDNSIMFLTPKNIEEAVGISKCKNCLIFVPRDFKVDTEYKARHCIQFSDNPRLDYAHLVNSILDKNKRMPQNYEIKNGSYISADAQIGSNVMIEPFCVIDGTVEIGDDTVIKSGVKIGSKVKIGRSCIVRENTVIGTEGFGFAKNKNKENTRFPFLGSIQIGDNVEIGAMCNIARAVADKTIIRDGVKTDSFTFIAHDVVVGTNSLLIGAKIGGHVVIGNDVFVGFGSTIKQRIIVGDGAQIGLGAAVVKNVPAGVTVAGNPARLLKESDLTKPYKR